jgi:type I restriction enzyme S subunit
LKRAVSLVNRKTTDTARSYVGLENVESWTGKFVVGESNQPGDSIASLFESGDVLFGKLRPYLAKVALAESPGRCTSELLVLRGAAFHPRFLQYVLLAEPFIRSVDASTFGSKMPRADWEFIGQVIVPVPEEGAQRAIASFLDRKTAAIDALIAKKERLIKLLREKRQALITQAVTKGLDPNVPMKESGVEWIGKTPVHWDVARVKHVAKLESGHTPSRSVPEHWLDSNDIPWVSLNDTKTLAKNDYISNTALCINKLGLQNSSAHMLPARIVVFTRDATIGKAAITTRPMAVSQHIIAWVCSPRIGPEYLLRVFYGMEQFLDRFTFGATIKTIGMGDVGKLVTPVPPRGEQAAIVEYVCRKVRQFENVVEKVEAQLARLVEYRQALITAAVTGKIDVSKEAT